METRARYVIVGAFVLLMAAGVVGFLVWAAKIGPDREYDFYTINFETAITGLSSSGSVRFNGIYVGSVYDIELDTEDPGRVRVDIRVYRGTPVTTHSIASLDSMGLTGGTFIQISELSEIEVSVPRGPIQITGDEDYPIIPSKVAGLSGIMLSAPELLAQGIELLARGNRVLSDENIQTIGNILADVETLTDGVAGKTEDIQIAISSFRSTMERFDRIAGSVEEMTDTELAQLMADFAQVAQNVKQLTESLDALVNENRTAITTFTSTALPELSQLATDARRLVSALSRIAEKLDENPADFIFPPKVPEIEAAE
jgi:phospholipid/cholesterol/gamma-HCH transport system substrate-binding protein